MSCNSAHGTGCEKSRHKLSDAACCCGHQSETAASYLLSLPGNTASCSCNKSSPFLLKIFACSLCRLIVLHCRVFWSFSHSHSVQAAICLELPLVTCIVIIVMISVHQEACVVVILASGQLGVYMGLRERLVYHSDLHQVAATGGL